MRFSSSGKSIGMSGDGTSICLADDIYLSSKAMAILCDLDSTCFRLPNTLLKADLQVVHDRS